MNFVFVNISEFTGHKQIMQNSDWIATKQAISEKPRFPEVYTLKNIVMLCWCGCRVSHDMGAA
jgi:hypothetical protein